MPRKQQFQFVEATATLDVSVIVPVRNEIRHIDECIESILGQEIRGRSIELIVADGQSDDGTLERLQDWARRDHRIRIVENQARKVSPALNLGMRIARGKIIVRLDAHAEYATDYLDQCLRVLEETGASAVGGIQVPTPGEDTKVAWAIASIQSSRLGMGGGTHRRLGYEGPAESVWLGAFRRETVEAVGGFDETLFRTEDNDFYQRVRENGGVLWTSYRIRARYYCRPTYATLARQYFVTGTEIFPTLVSNRKALAIRHLVPGLAMVIGSGLLLTTMVAPPPIGWGAGWLLGALATTYGVLVGLAARRLVRGNPRTGFLEVLSAFLTVHASYAIGTLVGLPATLQEFLRENGRFRASRSVQGR